MREKEGLGRKPIKASLSLAGSETNNYQKLTKIVVKSLPLRFVGSKPTILKNFYLENIGTGIFRARRV
jgi:hypothetical protein